MKFSPTIFKMNIKAYLVHTNTSSVPENQEAAQIFIKYMHDIVLQISFLDTNSQTWNTGSHLKL